MVIVFTFGLFSGIANILDSRKTGKDTSPRAVILLVLMGFLAIVLVTVFVSGFKE